MPEIMPDVKKFKILIVDDAPINRLILSEMLAPSYEIVEAENGFQAISILEDSAQDFSLVLLDLVMPELDGFGVLAYMNKMHWINDLPVIIISSETIPTIIRRAYKLGATDFMGRPFDTEIVRQRVQNTILLYAKQRRLSQLVTNQIYEKEKTKNLMVSVLSHIVEFRNGESGLHVLHISTITDLILRQLVQITDRYQLTKDAISLISSASALHDIGKITIPDEIINKPGKLTPEEYEIIKTHAAVGAQMLTNLPIHTDEPLIQAAYSICRWHHERYDGGGYPDGLLGDDIPIGAQVVALADVYDALTSERCYKSAFSHAQAVQMILNGECGAFNPLLLQCLTEIQHKLPEALDSVSLSRHSLNQDFIRTEIAKYDTMSTTTQQMNLMRLEREKYRFLVDIQPDIVFSYNRDSDLFSISAQGEQRMALRSVTSGPGQSGSFREAFGEDFLADSMAIADRTSPQTPEYEMTAPLRIDGQVRTLRIQCKALWLEEEKQCCGMIGRILQENPR